ncbi:L-threonylcarbamoyladenylate synthase [Noviherbaspirillum sp. Root189]|uniref:L-threonylcarbamoyladenylate synthase n=1 Tax=Noviherbaspirillum sp. Root189 TaxID=1736487 RepID=UPI00071044D7|nr:L-threonylcarbamoyladenylate synthase [Noviherbaspirillum sp. Root189]KRB92915.1 translation factor Sua5 [Noviherbaspirillum sp. Root189]
MSELDLSAIGYAARQLEAGELVAFPTETVYGLGADAENPAAVAKIYAAKGRPSNHPVIVHLAPGADIGYWTTEVPEQARQLIDAFWPGPLTLILKRAAHIPDAVSGGQDSVGVRCPSHPVAQALLRAFKGGKGGVAAPSANKFGHVSPTTAQHVRDEFASDADQDKAGPLACVLDGGQSDVGIESTIVDLTRMATHGPVLLRPGHISASDIARVIGIEPKQPDAAAPRASGTLEAHYAPSTPVALVLSKDLADTVVSLSAHGKSVSIICHSAGGAFQAAHPKAVLRLPATPDGYAYDLYAALRSADAVHADIILVEAPPVEPAWQGVNDRLRRAAYDSSGILSRLLNTTDRTN